MCAVGFLVAPVLFARLPDRALAGDVAGLLLHRIDWIGLICGGTLLGAVIWRRRGAWLRSARARLLVAMLVAVLAQGWVLAPRIVAARAAHAVDTTGFRVLHGSAAALYSLNCVLGLVLIALGHGRREEA